MSTSAVTHRPVPGAGLGLQDLATLGMQEILASLRAGHMPIRMAWVAVQGAKRYRELVAGGYVVSREESLRRAAICSACPSHRQTRGELGVEGVGTVPLLKGWCGHPLMPNLRPLSPSERTCGCLVTLTVGGGGRDQGIEGSRDRGEGEEQGTLSVIADAMTSLPGGESEGNQGEGQSTTHPQPPPSGRGLEGEGQGRGPRAVYAAGKTCCDESRAQRDGLLGPHAEIGCPQGKW